MVVVADSALQLSSQTIKELGIEVLEYPLFVNGQAYPVSMSMSREEKERLRDLIKDKKNNVSTSGLKEEDVRSLCQRHRGEKILLIHQSAKMSSITASVLQKVKADLADQDIELFDTHHMTSAYSVQVLLAARAARAGIPWSELAAMLKKNRDNNGHLGAVYDLFFLQRTGRIGRAKAVLGTAMKIIPLLGASQEAGVLQSIGKAKNYLQTNQRFVQLIEADLTAKKAHKLTAIISQIGPYDRETRHLKDMIMERGWAAEVEIVYSNHSNMPHAGPDFYDIGYVVHEA